MSEKLLTPDDVIAGVKAIEVETLDGRTETLRLTAPSRRQRDELLLRFASAKDFWVFADAALPAANRTDDYLRQLTPESCGRVQTYAIALTLGESQAKKMIGLGQKILEVIQPSIGSALKTD